MILNRKDKLKLFNVWSSRKCVCGNSKHIKHWICKECSLKIKGTHLDKDCADACNKHGEMILKVLEYCKENNANTRNST